MNTVVKTRVAFCLLYIPTDKSATTMSLVVNLSISSKINEQLIVQMTLDCPRAQSPTLAHAAPSITPTHIILSYVQYVHNSDMTFFDVHQGFDQVHHLTRVCIHKMF